MIQDGGGKPGDCGYRWSNYNQQNQFEEVTADWARKTAETQLGIKAEEELKKCLEAIKRAVSENKMSTTVYFYASKVCLEELYKRGFKATTGNDQREGSWTTITW